MVEELIRNTLIAVGTTPVVISEEQYEGNAQVSVRVYTNTSTAGQKITISVGDEAVANRGLVYSVGGFYAESIDSGFKPTNKRITAVADAAAGQLSIHERILMRGQ